MRPAPALALIVALGIVPAGASADEPSADALFEQGMADLGAKRYRTACPALRRSFRAEARAETLYQIGQCEEGAGHLTTAAAAYDDYLALYDRLSAAERKLEKRRERSAVERRAALEPRIPRVVFKLNSAPEGVRVTRRLVDGGETVEVALGVPLPIDPGEHFVATDSPDRPRWEKRFFINPGEHKTIDLDVAPPDKSRALRFAKPIAPVPNILPPLDPGPSAQRIAAYVTGGVGIAGLIVGAVTGAVAWGQKGTIESSCKDHLCNAEGQAAADKASTLGAVSTVSFVVGGVALATGIILYLTEPGRPKLGVAPRPFVFGLNPVPGGASAVTTWTF